MQRKQEEKIPYSLRLCAIVTDVFFATAICSAPGLIFSPLTALNRYIPLVIVVYYTWFDFKGTKSWGKRFLGISVMTLNGDPAPLGRRMMRAGFRWLFLPLAFIVWRRVSLLDLLSGTRLIRFSEVPVNLKEKKKKKRFLAKRVPMPERRAVH